MSASRHHEGVSGKWDALTEERDQLRERVDELEARNLEWQNKMAELQAGKALTLTQLKAALRDVLDRPVDFQEAPPLWLEQLDASIATAADREARARARERELEDRAALKLDEEEQEAFDALNAYMRIVVHRWKLRANTSEIIGSVHVLQAAVQQHMLNRLAPDEWSSWWEKLDKGQGDI